MVFDSLLISSLLPLLYNIAHSVAWTWSWWFNSNKYSYSDFCFYLLLKST